MAVSPETFRELDEALSRAFLPFWRRQFKDVAADIIRAVEDGDGRAADEAIQRFDLGVIARAVESRARLVGMSALVFGASQITDEDATVFSRSGPPEQLDAAVKQLSIMMDGLTERVKRRAAEGLQEHEARVAESRVYKQAEFVRPLVSFMGDNVLRAGEGSIQIASSLHTSRLAAWGFTEEALATGQDFYRINEQLDHRGCPVCATMHGKVFPVGPARERLDQALSLPEGETFTLKVLAPWPSQSRENVKQLGEMSAQDLIDRGHDTPPYHPRCRGYLSKIKEGDEIPDLSQKPRPSSGGAPVEFNTIGVSPDDLNFVEQMVGRGGTMEALWGENATAGLSASARVGVSDVVERLVGPDGEISPDLTRAMSLFRTSGPNDFVLRLNSQWNTVSGDNDPQAIAVQIAAQREFGLESASTAHLPERARTAALGEYGDAIPGIQEALRAQYSLTQDVLREAGISVLPLVRGVRIDHRRRPPDMRETTGVAAVESQPLSSYTWDSRTASDFAGESTIIGAMVPASRVMSLPSTGFGAFHEREVVVLGGRDGHLYYNLDRRPEGVFVNQLGFESRPQLVTPGEFFRLWRTQNEE